MRKGDNVRTTWAYINFTAILNNKLFTRKPPCPSIGSCTHLIANGSITLAPEAINATVRPSVSPIDACAYFQLDPILSFIFITDINS